VVTAHARERFAERTVHGIDDAGRQETVRVFIAWLDGGRWGVGRVVDGQHRENPKLARDEDWIFQGFEMADALAAANDALTTDLEVSRADGMNEDVRPFGEAELRRKLERWYFDHA
jgi:hypothetical protein